VGCGEDFEVAPYWFCRYYSGQSEVCFENVGEITAVSWEVSRPQGRMTSLGGDTLRGWKVTA